MEQLASDNQPNQAGHSVCPIHHHDEAAHALTLEDELIFPQHKKVFTEHLTNENGGLDKVGNLNIAATGLSDTPKPLQSFLELDPDPQDAIFTSAGTCTHD